MAIRTMREIGDEILHKRSKEVKKITRRDIYLIEDMLDTMYEMEGVGLAAPQVGVLKRIIVLQGGLESLDDSEHTDEYTEEVTPLEDPIILINPEIIEINGNQTGEEGCLSVPGKWGMVSRPEKVKIKAVDINMEEFQLEGEGLLARAICHEIDHLDGKLYVDLVEGELRNIDEKEGTEDAG